MFIIFSITSKLLLNTCNDVLYISVLEIIPPDLLVFRHRDFKNV
jgi:hypothetical protein